MGRYASTYFSPGRGTSAVVVGFIDRVQERLDVAVYSLTDDAITAALIRAHGRGVKVRVLLDKLMASQRASDDEKLIAAGVPVRYDHEDGAMHHKLAIADPHLKERAVGTGSYNWTANADKRNRETWIVQRLKYVVEDCLEEFERAWAANA